MEGDLEFHKICRIGSDLVLILGMRRREEEGGKFNYDGDNLITAAVQDTKLFLMPG